MVPRVQPWMHARKLKALAVCQHHVSALMLITSKSIISNIDRCVSGEAFVNVVHYLFSLIAFSVSKYLDLTYRQVLNFNHSLRLYLLQMVEVNSR